MDRFELHWPSMDAQLLTDGWRCRIVWRQKGPRSRHGAGMGGSIDNNLLCVRRVAESLDGAPELLTALKARGHHRLAEQIEALVSTEGASPADVRQEGASPEEAGKATTNAGEAPAEKRRTKQQRQPAGPLRKSDHPHAWLDRLEGDGAFAAAGAKRAKVWLEAGTLASAGESLSLKTPAAKGRQEWVLKRLWPGEPKRKAEYVAADTFKGILRWLVDAGADDGFFEPFFGALAGIRHAELEAAAAAWRAVHRTATH